LLAAGVIVHERGPLRLRDLELPHLKALGDLDSVARVLVGVADGVTIRASHHEFTWSDADELHAEFVLQLACDFRRRLPTRADSEKQK
jgi:hypothetical protein